MYNYNTKRYSIMIVYTKRSYAECDADYRYTVAFNDPLKENVWNVIFTYLFYCSNWNKFHISGTFEMRTSVQFRNFIQLIIFSSEADHFISKVETGEQS